MSPYLTTAIIAYAALGIAHIGAFCIYLTAADDIDLELDYGPAWVRGPWTMFVGAVILMIGVLWPVVTLFIVGKWAHD